MNRVIGLVVMVSVLLLWLTGCGAGKDTAVPIIQYPALILFYTDG